VTEGQATVQLDSARPSPSLVRNPHSLSTNYQIELTHSKLAFLKRRKVFGVDSAGGIFTMFYECCVLVVFLFSAILESLLSLHPDSLA
jgi:hypothetical protein